MRNEKRGKLYQREFLDLELGVWDQNAVLVSNLNLEIIWRYHS